MSTYRLPKAFFFSLIGAVICFSEKSDLSVLSALALSVDEVFREGGLGFAGEAADRISCFGVEMPDGTVCELILFSDLIASFVENIRVRRFVIDGFSAGTDNFCGSAGGAALPLRLSVLGTAIPFWEGREFGDSMMDDAVDVVGDGRALSARRSSRCAATVAMMLFLEMRNSTQQGLGRYKDLLIESCENTARRRGQCPKSGKIESTK